MKNYYTLADLEQEGAPVLNGKKARLAVIGCPIAHSRSPQMQQAALDAAGVEALYIRVEAQPDEFAQVIRTLQALDFIGANVTIPHKAAAAAIAQEHDDLVVATGVANTLVFPQEPGDPLRAFNTDGPGFVRAIRECFSVDLQDLKIVLFGANGGAGTALAHVCSMNHCERLTLVARSMEKTAKLKKALQPHFIDEHRLEGSADRLVSTTFDSPNLRTLIEDADLIINATSVGLKPTDPSPIPPTFIQAYHLVYDLITHPDAFQKTAASRGARCENGLSMLVFQGAFAFEHWFGISPNITAMKRGLSRE